MKLTEFELDIMQLFWDEGRLNTNEVAKSIADKKGISPKTVKTVIRRLEEKGAITLVGQANKTFIFDPALSREEASNELLPTFLRRLFGDNPRDLIASVITKNKLNKSDIDYIKTLLEEHKDPDG